MTIRSEIVALLNDPLDDRVYADKAPESTEFPYGVVIDGIDESAAYRGDERAMAFRRLVQVDVWQLSGLEDPDVVDAVVDALDGAQIDSGLHLSVQSSPRIPDPAADRVHHAVTVAVVRLRG